jgi:hypothetical protein
MSFHTANLRWKIVTFLVAPITFVMTLDRTAMTVAAPTIQKEFGLSIVEMSMILTVYFWFHQRALVGHDDRHAAGGELRMVIRLPRGAGWGAVR